MGRIYQETICSGSDGSLERKTEKKKTNQQLKRKKTETKDKTVEQRKPMNSQVICEISPECTNGLWREGFMKKKCFEATMKECRSDGW